MCLFKFSPRNICFPVVLALLQSNLPLLATQAPESVMIEKGHHLRMVYIKGFYTDSAGYYKFKLDHVTVSHVDKLQFGNDPGIWPTFEEANKSVPMRGDENSPYSLIVEYIISDKKSLFKFVAVVEGGFESIDPTFFTDEDAIGYRVYNRSRRVLGGEYFRATADPQVTLESLPEGRFILRVADQPTRYVPVQWSLDQGKTWSANTITHSNENRVRIPKHVLTKDQEIQLEFDVVVGMKLFRKRFIYNGDGKPLRGELAPRPLRKEWQPTKANQRREDGWEDLKQ